MVFVFLYDRSDDNSSDQPSGSRPEGSLGGSSSFVSFQTSFGSSGCRNCETEEVPTSKEKEILSNSENNSNDKLSPLSSIKDIPNRKRRSRWCKKMCEIRNEELNATIEEPITPYLEQPLLSSPCESSDIENSPTLLNNFVSNSNNNINTNVNNATALPSPNAKRKCQLSQFKSKCLIEVLRKCNARNVVQEYLNSLLEKHSKKFVTLS